MKQKNRTSKIWLWYFMLSIIIFSILWATEQLHISFGNPDSGNHTFSWNGSGVIDFTGNLYISPYDSFDAYRKSLSGSKNLHIWTYDFTEQQIKEQFKELLSHGSTISMIMENFKFRQYKNTRQQLQEYFTHMTGFQLHSDKGLGTQYQHAKVTLINTGSFWINTANLTHSSFFKNREYWFYSHQLEIFQSLMTLFEKDWQQEHISPEDIHPNLLVCPLNCRSGIETLLNNAKESIIMQEQYLLDTRIINILKDKAEDQNFNLKITLANPNKNFQRANYFGTHRVRVLKKPYIHAKMILIDKKILILGSMNISDTSLDKNREIGIIITDPGIIATFLEQFKKDREKSEK